MAVTLKSSALADVLGVDSSTADRLLDVAILLVESYAPLAPDAVSNEAAIRTAGWLHETPHGNIRSESEGDITTSYAIASMSALRHSGAMALLSVWKVRRAGTI